MRKIAQYWADLPLKFKGFIVVGLPLLVLLAAFGSLYLREQRTYQLEINLQSALNNQQHLLSLNSQLMEITLDVRDYLLTNDKSFLAEYHTMRKQTLGTLMQLADTLTDTNQHDILNKIKPLISQNLKLLDQIVQHDLAEQDEKLIRLFDDQAISLRTIKTNIAKMSAQEAKLAQENQASILEQHQRSLLLVLLTALLTMLATLFGSWLFSHGIVKQIQALRDSAAYLSKGEPLALPQLGRDELGQLSSELEHAADLLSKTTKAALDAKHEAEEANTAKSRFLSRTSHELRTPLNAILGFAQLLEIDLANDSRQRHASTIKEAGDHLLKVIDEILDLARLDAKEHSLKIEDYLLAPIVDGAIHFIQPLGKIRDIKIESICDANLVIHADAQKTRQILLNLLSNAIKYGPPNEKVTVLAQADKTHILIEVMDTGAGIPMSMRNRIFTPFDRLGAEKTRTPGTGLGLALCKELAEAMQGDIRLANNRSAFTLRLPIGNPSVAQKNQTIPIPITIKNEIETTESAKLERVLYIEDNASNRALVEAIFTRQHHLRLDCVRSIKDALHYFEEIKPSLILLDLNLPDGSGEQVIDWLQNHLHWHETPVVVMSADATASTRERLKHTQIVDYMTKPIDVAYFQQHLPKWLAIKNE